MQPALALLYFKYSFTGLSCPGRLGRSNSWDIASHGWWWASKSQTKSHSLRKNSLNRMFEFSFVIFSKLRDLSRFFGAWSVLFSMTTNIRTVYIRRSSWISHFLPLGDFLTWEFSSYWLNNKVAALKFTSTGHFQLCFCDLTWNYMRGP